MVELPEFARRNNGEEMMASILLCTLFVAGAATERPAPLTPQQITKLQQVVRRTQDRNVKLKAALDDRQQELMKAYSQFKLREKRISQLHKEIINLQRELLENYRDLQVELRDIVGEQRFIHLKKRIDLFLKGKKKVQASPGTSSRKRAAAERKPSSAKSQAP